MAEKEKKPQTPGKGAKPGAQPKKGGKQAAEPVQVQKSGRPKLNNALQPACAYVISSRCVPH